MKNDKIDLAVNRAADLIETRLVTAAQSLIDTVTAEVKRTLGSLLQLISQESEPQPAGKSSPAPEEPSGSPSAPAGPHAGKQPPRPKQRRRPS